MYYRTCPYCGCNLDPGEQCDCRERKFEQNERFMSMFESDRTGQIQMKVEDLLLCRSRSRDTSIQSVIDDMEHRMNKDGYIK